MPIIYTSTSSATTWINTTWIDNTAFTATGPPPLITTWTDGTTASGQWLYVPTSPYFTYPMPTASLIGNQIRERRILDEATPPPNLERARLRRSARERARGALLAHLSDEQKDTLERLGWFLVEGGVSRQRYRIRAEPNLVGNIDVLQDERVLHRLCAHCDTNEIPFHDHLLAQKLMLEGDENEFLRIANRHGAYRES